MNMKQLKDAINVELEIKKSRFITYLFPVDNEVSVKLLINDVKLKHPKANHHCFAYVLSKDNIERFDDDHEPTHTAGKPMLYVLLQQEIDQTLAITVRYYGGIKLGKGGLVKAYTQGVATALSKATYQSFNEVTYVMFSCPNQFVSQVEAYCHHVGELIDSSFDNERGTFTVKLMSEVEFIIHLESMTKGTIEIHDIEKILE